jgi:MoxR-like ATPase
MEVAVATLATDRALLLLGVPGTAKTWVSEHLAAAVSGDSTLLVQGTAGTPEEAIRYGWNYARLLAEGPTGRRWCQPGACGRWRRAIARSRS